MGNYPICEVAAGDVRGRGDWQCAGTMLVANKRPLSVERQVLTLLVGVVTWPMRMGMYVAGQRAAPGSRAARLTVHFGSDQRSAYTAATSSVERTPIG